MTIRAASSSVFAESLIANRPEPARHDLSPSTTIGWVSHTPTESRRTVLFLLAASSS